jgi:hypothetical protein
VTWYGRAGRAALAALIIQAGCVEESSANGGIGLAVTPGVLSVAQGGSATTTVTLSRIGGYGSPVTLTASGLPAGVTVTFAPQELTGTTANAVMTVSASGTAPVGTFNATISGSAPGINTISIVCQITVTAATGSVESAAPRAR